MTEYNVLRRRVMYSITIKGEEYESIKGEEND
jgi:hypothetical protein